MFHLSSLRSFELARQCARLRVRCQNQNAADSFFIYLITIFSYLSPPDFLTRI